ncbi:MAG: hypothetical protein M3O46_12520 [Myxococcota bacterium]|nr:hypothetical protein [Myxococcota bacterium]
MHRWLNDGNAPLRAIVLIGIVGAACLTRPIETHSPTPTISFTKVIHSQAVDKIDLLFMIDNSASMGDKQALLAQAVPDLINRLVQPNCVDPKGKTLGISDPNTGQCATGTPEFPPVHDMHIGIVTSSLGGRGGNQCSPAERNEANMNLNAHQDDRGELINRGGDMETPVAKAMNDNFLAWYPPVAANKSASAMPPPNPETVLGMPGQPDTLLGDFTSMIHGVHEHGCGFEAQNEAWYRFLVQPDPFDAKTGIVINNNRASLQGTDTTILQQRKAFLRPDSLLTVVVVTDENEEVANPMAIGGEGWLYESAPFPGSPTFGAPEATIECTNNGPNDPNCTSCAFQSVQSASNFSARCAKDPPAGVLGFLDPSNDSVNVRFFNQKQRFGVFAGYPISRYVRGLTRASVPDRAHEVDGNGNYVGDQDKYANCTNPIYAQDLPISGDANALCNLTRGPRTPDLVYYAAIAGVPHQLLQARSGVDSECQAGTPQADCPQKDQLTDGDWKAITGTDPERYDFSGIDPHMLESEEPRSGLSCGPTSNDDCDPINGREWTTNKQDLQFACIFALVNAQTGMPQPKDCTQPQFSGACDCRAGSNSQETPLCQRNAGVHGTTQVNGKAYPSIREMAIARAMATSTGVQGIVSSLCPIHVSPQGGLQDPLYGYRPAANAIVNRLKSKLMVECLPQALNADATGAAPCLILVTLPKAGGQGVCDSVAGLHAPTDADVLSRFRASQHAAWVQSGNKSGLPDPDLLPVCELDQLTRRANPMAFGPDNTCSESAAPGWCYVEGAAALTCPQQILFTANEPPAGATVNLQCIEGANSAVDGGS